MTRNILCKTTYTNGKKTLTYIDNKQMQKFIEDDKTNPYMNQNTYMIPNPNEMNPNMKPIPVNRQFCTFRTRNQE